MSFIVISGLWGVSIGHKGIVYTAKALSMTMVDLFNDKVLFESVKEEFKIKEGDYQHEELLTFELTL